MNNKCIWIDDTIFNWEVYSSSSSIMSNIHVKRAYEFWEHARTLLGDNASDFSKADAITNLKRSLNHRWQLIEKLYVLKKLVPAKGNLERLEEFGLVRPYMLRQLLEIRNNIEHNDQKPPEINRCMELLDLTWYFLRSTDRLVINQINDLLFSYLDDEGNETQYWIQLDIDFLSNHKMTINGWLPKAYISPMKTDTHNMQITLERISDRFATLSPKEHTDKLDTDMYIIGNIEDNSVAKLNIMKIYFMCNE